MNKNAKKFAIIIGAMKSGTTALYRYLIELSSICPCPVKEPDYFCISKNHVQARRVRDVKNYEDLWSHFEVEKHIYCLEASTGYTKYPFNKGVPERMYGYQIFPKFIYIVRDPIDRIESQVNFEMNIEGKKYEEFTHPELIELSKYNMQLERYRRTFGEELQLFIIDSDDLKNKPEKVIEECIAFLDISCQDVPGVTGEKFNKSQDTLLDRALGQIRSNWIVNKIFSGGRRGLAQRIVRPLLPYLRSVSPNANTHTMSQQQEEKVKELLYEDMSNFEDNYNFPVSKWGF